MDWPKIQEFRILLFSITISRHDWQELQTILCCFLPYFYACSGLNHIINLNIAHAMMCFWNCWVCLKYKTSSKDALPQLKNNKQTNFVNILKKWNSMYLFWKVILYGKKKNNFEVNHHVNKIMHRHFLAWQI